MFTFPKPGPAGVPCQAHFYTWTQLSELCSTLFTSFFGRPTPVQAVGEFNRDSWCLEFLESPLSYEDLTAIFTALKADDYDQEANDVGAYPVWELSQSLCQKLVSLTLPFPVAASHTSDDGVWFTGNTAEYGVAVIRQRCDGRNSEIYYSSFRIAQARLPEPSEEACEAYLRKVIYEFLQTEDGKRAYEETCRDFNWGDVETEIPDDFFSAYGVTHCCSGHSNGQFLCCGLIGILVDQDEPLGRDVYDNEKAEL